MAMKRKRSVHVKLPVIWKGDSNESSPDTDKDFDPSADMLVHDYDDENTLEDEENLSNSDASSELDNLQKEGDMPIEDLLAMYGYGGGGGGVNTEGQGSSSTNAENGGIGVQLEQSESRSSSEDEILSNQDLTLDKDEVARDLLQDDEDSNKETSATDLLESIPSQTVRLLRSSDNPDDSDDSEDIDYDPVEDGDWKKSIQVGRDYQAVIPQGLHRYGDAPAYENEDRLLWDPFRLSDKEVEGFLRDVQLQNLCATNNVTKSIPQGAHIRDDEQALYLLLQCGHNVEEALRRRKMQAVPPTDPMSLWSEEECRNFENGLKSYGKDFYLIQGNKVRTRSVGELVQFYYLWKKTERHDMFANKNRLEKKKYTLHPGVTDYMDRFLDEQENQPLHHKDRPASPLNSLLYGDPKRHLPTDPGGPITRNTAELLVNKLGGCSSSADVVAKLATEGDIAAVVEVVQKAIDSNVLMAVVGVSEFKLNDLGPGLSNMGSNTTIAVPSAGDCAPRVLAGGGDCAASSPLASNIKQNSPHVNNIATDNLSTSTNCNSNRVLDETGSSIGEPAMKRLRTIDSSTSIKDDVVSKRIKIDSGSALVSSSSSSLSPKSSRRTDGGDNHKVGAHGDTCGRALSPISPRRKQGGGTEGAEKHLGNITVVSVGGRTMDNVSTSSNNPVKIGGGLGNSSSPASVKIISGLGNDSVVSSGTVSEAMAH